MIDTLLFIERKETDKMDKKNMFSLEGKIALVTGGAHGIGFAIAESYAEAGATVVFNCSNEESLKRGLAAYKEKGIDAHGYVCDVTDEEAVKKMIADIEEKIGTVDILVNNAGMIRRIPMHEMSAEEFRKVVDVDLNAPFIMAKAVLPAMMKKRSGKIINICSMMSELGRETVSAYAAAKGGTSPPSTENTTSSATASDLAISRHPRRRR